MTDPADLSRLLGAVGGVLDIPESVYDEATSKYEDVAGWLGAEDSALAEFEPDLYVQGSFRLGTIVRPLTDADEYDIDLVCRLSIAKEGTTQAELKALVGDRLRKRPDLASVLKVSRRCWRLDYQQGAGKPAFHMDVLPAIPNSERLPTGLLLTDKELRLWQKSNPIAYAEWFYERMRVVLQEQRARLAKAINASIEEIPVWKVKTPLQVAVQVLKRHRDVHFRTRPDVRPISVIITTLAAKAYSNQADVADALQAVVERVESDWGKPGFIESRNGKWWIPNPVDPDENFADKWNEYPERREAFQSWARKFQADIRTALSSKTLLEAANGLSTSLGREPLSKALRSVQNEGVVSGAVIPYKGVVPALGSSHHVQTLQEPQHLTHSASVDGTVHLKQHGPKLWTLSDRPVDKRRWLQFKVRTNVPGPYKVRWQVVNTGSEAAQSNSLRGDFYDGEGGSATRWESTLYRGTHWVEAFIIKNGICLARSGRTLVRVK